MEIAVMFLFRFAEISAYLKRIKACNIEINSTLNRRRYHVDEKFEL